MDPDLDPDPVGADPRRSAKARWQATREAEQAVSIDRAGPDDNGMR